MRGGATASEHQGWGGDEGASGRQGAPGCPAWLRRAAARRASPSRTMASMNSNRMLACSSTTAYSGLGAGAGGGRVFGRSRQKDGFGGCAERLATTWQPGGGASSWLLADDQAKASCHAGFLLTSSCR
jgi:hypothetical protein